MNQSLRKEQNVTALRSHHSLVRIHIYISIYQSKSIKLEQILSRDSLEIAVF